MNLASHLTQSAEPALAIAIESEELRNQILSALAAVPGEITGANCWAPDLPELLVNVARARPSVLLLGLPGLGCNIAEAIARVGSLDQPPRIIAVSDCADAESILKVMRAGASEFVYPPFETNLAEACARAQAEWLKLTESNRKLGSVIGFVSAKGGCGATTLACHSAAFLRTSGEKQVLVADLDQDSGISSALLQTQPRYSVADAIQHLHRLDAMLWKSLVATASNGVDVIPPPATPGGLGGISRKLQQLLRFWRLQYEFTIADFGSGYSPVLAEQLESIDTLVLVTTNEVPALRQARQMMLTIGATPSGNRRVRLVINRLPRRPEMPVEELERVLGYKIYATLPNDYRALSEAYADARLLDPDSHLGGHMAQFAAKVAGVAPAKKARKFALFG